VAVPIISEKTFTVIVWSAPTRRVDHIQALDGLFFCAKRSAAQTIGFDAETFRGFHFYDLDFTFRAHLAGFRLSVANDLFAIHDSLGNPGDAWAADARRFLEKFGRLLPPVFNRGTRFTMITVPSPKDVVEVMTQPHWSDEQ
jgi:GT2 family glycosyltransferase